MDILEPQKYPIFQAIQQFAEEKPPVVTPSIQNWNQVWEELKSIYKVFGSKEGLALTS